MYICKYRFVLALPFMFCIHRVLVILYFKNRYVNSSFYQRSVVRNNPPRKAFVAKIWDF